MPHFLPYFLIFPGRFCNFSRVDYLVDVHKEEDAWVLDKDSDNPDNFLAHVLPHFYLRTPLSDTQETPSFFFKFFSKKIHYQNQNPNEIILLLILI